MDYNVEIKIELKAQYKIRLIILQKSSTLIVTNANNIGDEAHTAHLNFTFVHTKLWLRAHNIKINLNYIYIYIM